MASVSAMNCVFLVCLCMGLVSYADSECPRSPDYGYWDEDTDNDRCILRCNGGYEPSGCHVIRYNSWTEKWNRDIPSCQKEWPVSGKTGVATVVATPVLLAGAGFTAARVAAGSIAAMLQIPFAPIRWFPKPRSVDVMGTGFSICEEE